MTADGIAATSAQLEDALIVASLAHATATTPKQRREAWEQIERLKQMREVARC